MGPRCRPNGPSPNGRFLDARVFHPRHEKAHAYRRSIGLRSGRPPLSQSTIFQGGIGWWMVKSGLHQQENMIIINREDAGWKDVIQPGVPRVSQYRLAIHLGTAFVLYTMFVWTGLTYLIKPHDVGIFLKA